jgi:hypothetical protein
VDDLSVDCESPGLLVRHLTLSHSRLNLDQGDMPPSFRTIPGEFRTG